MLATAILDACKAVLLAGISAVFVGCAVVAFVAAALGLLAAAVYIAGWRVRAWLAAPTAKE
jgi:hypothetical protein